MSRLKLTGPALFIAILASWPALEHGLFDHTLSIETMLIRVGIAIALTMIGQAVLASVIDNYRLQNVMRKHREEAGLAASDDEARQRS
jgi:hypothetical protein